MRWCWHAMVIENMIHLTRIMGWLLDQYFIPIFFVQTTHRVSSMIISYETIAEMSLWCVPLDIYLYYDFHTTFTH